MLFYNNQFGWPDAVRDATISTLLLCLNIWAIILILRAYPTTAMVYLYSIFIAVFLGIIATWMQKELLQKWMDNISISYLLWLKSTFAWRLLLNVLFNIWIATSGALRKILLISEERFQQQSDASVLLKEAELHKLRHQLQPHFLYNSLNSISALIMIEPEKAQEMIGKLSDFLRSSINKEGGTMLSIKDELNYLQSYLDIESVRFGDRLKVNFKVDNSNAGHLPPFLLQPIIENAIKFGLYGKTGKVDIDVNINLSDQYLTIAVTNPFDPNLQPSRGTGFGLQGIKRRLWLQFARADLLETTRCESEGDNEYYFKTILKIPQ